MSAAPERYKSRHAWSVAEIVRHQNTGERPESAEYKQARRSALEAAGLQADDDPADRPLEELTVEEHERRIYGDN